MLALASRLALVALTALLAVPMAAAQEPPKPGEQLQKDTNCPPSPAAGVKPGDAQPVEKSAILPSAGGHQNSAAPSVQQDGKPLEQRADCPKLPQDPKPAKPAG